MEKVQDETFLFIYKIERAQKWVSLYINYSDLYNDKEKKIDKQCQYRNTHSNPRPITPENGY